MNYLCTIYQRILYEDSYIRQAYGANPGDLSWDGLNEVGPVTIYDRTKPEETVGRAC